MSAYSRLDVEDDDPGSLSTQPLIANPDVLATPVGDERPEDGAITGWIWLLTLTAGISGLLFGCKLASTSV